MAASPSLSNSFQAWLVAKAQGAQQGQNAVPLSQHRFFGSHRPQHRLLGSPRLDPKQSPAGGMPKEPEKQPSKTQLDQPPISFSCSNCGESDHNSGSCFVPPRKP